MEDKKVTALLTTYNASSWVESAIDSVLAQTLLNFDFLVIDDGSTDSTVQKIQQYSDSRIILITHDENKGVGCRLDEALDLVKTPYIAKVDADDISVPNRFETQLEFIEKHNADIIKSHFSYFSDNEDVAGSSRFTSFKNDKERAINGIASPDDINVFLPQWPCFPHTTYFAKTDVIKSVRYPHLRMFEDYVLFLRLHKQGARFDCVEKTLVHMRVSDTSTTATLSQRNFDEGLAAVINEKIERLTTCVSGKEVYVFGSGQMGRSFCKHSSKINIEVSGFVEREESNSSIMIDVATHIPVLSLSHFLSRKANKVLIIAAQPVRAEITAKLASLNMKEGLDFFILA
ncbi:glycosyl transferase [Alteromonas sp. KS69]|jgi:hypothetical protein|uniref:glycosyltransferase family 2 protein n=1 Tax=Alteromonas sp. KS69 TaxID=2109917 RepID=UPI000F8811C5|nr:glycosyltransferase [Alteromonas sp. KS69]RUP82655.1 glycosyl transferase [Alteromonas sp. KS69]|tara:strand:- start:17513 stop:18547 length:1035 start_codon:yes stop_codon:yes gene_type:complete